LPETETETETENKVSSKKIPNWIDEKLWTDFKSHRKAIKKPMTDKAEKLLINKLDKLRQEGNDPKTVIEESIANGWQGVFPLKDKPYKNPYANAL